MVQVPIFNRRLNEALPTTPDARASRTFSDRGGHVVRRATHIVQSRTSCPMTAADRPWSPRGVPTPMSRRISSPRLNPLAWTSTRFKISRRCLRRMPPVSYACAKVRSRYSPRRRNHRFSTVPRSCRSVRTSCRPRAPESGLLNDLHLSDEHDIKRFYSSDQQGVDVRGKREPALYRSE